MKNTIEFLKKDRRVNNTFIEKLEKVGLSVNYSDYSYWQHQPYVQIGRRFIYLVDDCCTNGNFCIFDRYQNEVIKEILFAIKTEKESAENADKLVDDFFIKLGLGNEKS